MMIEGACHCGTVTWRFADIPESATSCNCTLCRRYGALWVYGFKDEEIDVNGPTRSYLRDPRTIEFHFCRDCGCVTYWKTKDPGEDGRHYIAVNLRLAEPKSISTVPIQRFDGLAGSGKLPRDATCVSDLWY